MHVICIDSFNKVAKKTLTKRHFVKDNISLDLIQIKVMLLFAWVEKSSNPKKL